MSVDLNHGATEIDSANKSQASQGLIIQTYCQSVKSQPAVNFAGYDNLKRYEQDINTGLGQAKAHADTYINVIQPTIITNISNISNYYAMQNAIPVVLPAGATSERWLQILATLEKMATAHKATADATVTALNGLYNNLTEDAGSFTDTVGKLNSAVNGDNGVISSINDQLKDIQSRIDGTIAGVVVSGLAIVGGVFLTAVGGIAEFVTAGTSTPLVVLGVAITLAGVGGAVAAGLALKGLYDSKARLLTDKSRLSDEVGLALGISQGFSGLSNQVQGAVTAALQMSKAWNILSSDLGTVADDIRQGRLSTDDARTLFLTAANSQVQQVTQDISIIKGQMTGVTNLEPMPNRNIKDIIDDLERRVVA
ncbi:MULTISPECIES: HBL/NHE enterotoxin family protein [unclassified Tolypothrix]|uniref:HBL/NHE enterotoxin family protein n=1 Tax=unclassified Tolypothrix TaxID=2649714 RepID=UPI0005EAC07A|nr:MULTISPECIES: HBL/NHE enterotoxin family protein [unclassified Tolypothrix]BAY91033.1 hypothetical protein NIES3275_30530 [Microchaete diplosiphon NIES-3275]EKE99706.1 hypothetical protein FDUTEX481_09583 [Tolypothrix sp. PCC 7601]MBE9081606.1 HBL/NHE enterotoxin family protein [Tolypothrix sp. LEGE 11397]UYD25135.1 HBL/NHE enterotoxin family protein [Tolypothrix sp. PCC 7712]UYD32626.1 HBL/NHE enterotoxin family protein [Tolypothrix sp. PCC 7601]